MTALQIIGIMLIFMAAVLIVQSIRISLLARAQRRDRYELEVVSDLLRFHMKDGCSVAHASGSVKVKTLKELGLTHSE